MTSGVDAVDGSSTGTRVPWMWVLLRLPRFGGGKSDAEAICEAVTRPKMRFVATKTPEQQSCLTLHRTRHLFIRQQTSVINAIRAHLAEFGIVAPSAAMVLSNCLVSPPIRMTSGCPRPFPCVNVAALGAQLRMLKAQDLAVRSYDRERLALGPPC